MVEFVAVKLASSTIFQEIGKIFKKIFLYLSKIRAKPTAKVWN